ncbi:MAG: ComEA family DNA-binding protein [Peptococcaceae bacterium]|nr:ComEA family DNA-binding protein [Candidatus Syntrophopropionicum ammoniitolerans]
MSGLIQIEKRQQLILLLLVGIILFGGGYRLAQVKERAAVVPVVETPAPEENKVKNISVHVIGAVANPGVYELPADARVTNAVNMANPLGEADLHALKLAAKIVDGQDIYVPYQGERDGPVAAGNQLAAPGAGRDVFSAGMGAAAGGQVNINDADQTQLETLPGIGPALAQRIIQHREANGPFQSPEDLKDVSGIGDKKFADLKDKITVY